jgi:hypothetical protein
MLAYWLTSCTSRVSTIIAPVMQLQCLLMLWQTRSSVRSSDV